MINPFCFPEPLPRPVKRTLTISNDNTHPVAFKVKATAPKVHLHSRILCAQLEYAYRLHVVVSCTK